MAASPSVIAIANTANDNDYQIVYNGDVIARHKFDPDPLYQGIKFKNIDVGSQLQMAIEVSWGGNVQNKAQLDYGAYTRATAANQGQLLQLAFAPSGKLFEDILSFDEMSAARSSKGSFQRPQQRFSAFMEAAKWAVCVDTLYCKNTTGIVELEETSNASATTTTGTIECDEGVSSYAPGMFLMAAGTLKVDVTTKAAPTVVLNTSGEVTVSAVNQWDPDTKTLLLTAAAADITAIDNATGPLLLFPRGQVGVDLVPGIDGFCSLSSTGTYLGQALGTHPTWSKHSAVALGGQNLTIPVILDQLHKIRTGLTYRGDAAARSAKITLLISERTWVTLVTYLVNVKASTTPYAGSGTFATGAGTISVHYSDALPNCTIVTHPLIKESEAFFVALSKWNRAGMYDLVLQPPGMLGDLGSKQVTFQSLDSSTALRYSAYYRAAPMTFDPLAVIKVTGISNAL